LTTKEFTLIEVEDKIYHFKKKREKGEMELNNNGR